ncbi:MAG: FkbM family methyltransferase [Chlamydiales bacterium]|nr:FkbM family methyltransferase [Chlamydiales bacterium]
MKLVVFLLFFAASAWCQKMECIGSDYGGWTIPLDSIHQNSIVYLAGVGEDITFDVGLIHRFGCHVHSFDPTPRAINHIKSVFSAMKAARSVQPEPPSKPYPVITNIDEKLHFFPFGLWDENTTLKFYAPRNPRHVSHSALNLQKTKQYFMAPCRRLKDIMAELGHDHIDLLKLDIEGAEYRVLDSILKDNLDIRMICVEFDEFAGMNKLMNNDIQDSTERTIAIVDRLEKRGYSIAYQYNWTEVLFIKSAP